MAATTYTLTGNVHDALGGAPSFDLTGLDPQVWLEMSQEVIADSTTNEVRVGRIPVTPDGTGNFVVTVVGTGTVVSGYRFCMAYRDAAFYSQRKMFASGWFPITANTTLTTALASSLTLVQVDTSTLESVYDARDEAVEAASEAAAFGGTNNHQVAQFVSTPGETQTALSATYAPGGSAGNINKPTAQGIALVQALIFGS